MCYCWVEQPVVATQDKSVDRVIPSCLLTDFAMCLSDLVNVEIGELKSLITIIYFDFQFC